MAVIEWRDALADSEGLGEIFMEGLIDWGSDYTSSVNATVKLFEDIHEDTGDGFMAITESFLSHAELEGELDYYKTAVYLGSLHRLLVKYN